MNCNHCKIVIENGLKRITGIDYAVADVINGEVTIKGSTLDAESIKNTIEDLGYFFDGEIK